MSIGNKIFNGLIWSGISRLSLDIANFVLGIILARILSPYEYGLLGILLVFITISNVFVDSGFSSALIQKQDRNENDKSTVLIFNFLISILFYVLLLFSAPYIAVYYENPILKELLQVLALVLILNGAYAVPKTLFTIRLDFKSLAKINLTSTIIAGVVAILFALNGWGVWALVIQSLVKAFLNALIMWVQVKWKPNWKFSIDSFKSLFSYGSNLLVSSLLNTGVNQVSSLFIAKMMSTQDLGFYTRGVQFANTASSTIGGIINNVLLPGLSTIQDDLEKLISHTKALIKMTTLVVMPVFLLLAIVAEPLILLLLGEKWLPAVEIMQIICIARFVTIVSSISINLLYVIGRTDLALKQQYLKMAIRLVILFISLQFGLIYVALGELLSTVIHFFINTYYPGKIMGYGASNQLKDIKFILLSGLFMAVGGYIISLYIQNAYLNITVVLLFGLFSYYLLLKIFKVKEQKELINKLLGLVRKD